MLCANEIKEKVNSYRDFIKHEDNLIDHRMNWLLISQSFILAACISVNLPISVSLICINIAFIVCSVYNICLAFSAINKTKKKYNSLFETSRTNEKPKDYPLTPLGEYPLSMNYFSFFISVLIPVLLFLIVWLIILANGGKVL
ncbi:MAG: hypothetical protein AAF621_06940 [Pseudomonadota bacterium]